MAGPGERVAAWTIESAEGPVKIYGTRSHKPSEIYFEWQLKGHEPATQRISRHVTGTPARLLVYRQRNLRLTVGDTVGWVFDPHHEPDPVAAAVLEFVDGLPVGFLLDFARKAAADDLTDAEDRVERMSRDLEYGRTWVATCRLTEAALMFDDLEQVKVALALLPDWAGTPEELVLAVLAVTGPAG